MWRRSCSEKQKLRKGLWSPEEDEKLYNYVRRFGVGCWSSVPKLAGLERCGKSCRLRWINYLRPDLKRGMFSQLEEDIIINLHETLGNKWAQIAQQLPGRTDNEIKNFWNSSIKKKLMKLGIDPNTHKLINEIKDDNRDFITDSATQMFPNLVASTGTEHQSYHLNNTNEGLMQASRNNFLSKQVYDHPIFLSGFHSTIDPSNIQTKFQQNPINGFNAMQNLSNFGNQNMRMDNTEYYSDSSKLNALFFMNEAKESSSTSMVENPNTFFWDASEDNKLESVFQFPQFSGIQNQELKQTPLLHFHNPSFEEDYSNFQEFTETNMDVFQQL